MFAIRSMTTLFLLLTGLLLMPSEFVLLALASLTHPLPRAVLTSGDTSDGGAQGGGVAGCHEESAPDHAPANHDCCTIGHLHAIASASVILAPVFAVSPISSSLIQSASIRQIPSQIAHFSDTGPPGSAVPIRI